jgi:hypothetical protein
VRSNRTLVALMVALMLVVPGLGCAGYGVLLHAQVVEPPQAHIRVGQFALLSTISYRCSSPATFHCGGETLQHSPAVYSVWLFRYAENPSGAPSATVLLRRTLPPPDTITDSLILMPYPVKIGSQRSSGYCWWGFCL